MSVCEKSGSEERFRIGVLASDFASLLLLSRWHSCTIKRDKRRLVLLDFLSVPQRTVFFDATATEIAVAT